MAKVTNRMPSSTGMAASKRWLMKRIMLAYALLTLTERAQPDCNTCYPTAPDHRTSANGAGGPRALPAPFIRSLLRRRCVQELAPNSAGK